MNYDTNLIAQKLRRWDKYMAGYVLPTWDELPSIDLYMEQVITLLNQYLDFLPKDERENDIVTVSAINNYVRLKIMPAPRRKKYSRVHIAYLIMICTLKQSLSIAYIRKMIPVGIDEDEVRRLYDGYVMRHKASNSYFVQQVRQAAASILGRPSESDNSVEDIVFSSAVISGFLKLLTEKIVNLQDETITVADGDFVEIDS